MPFTSPIRPLAAASLAFAAALPAAAQYPAKPIRLVVPFPPGASNDTVARAAGQKLSEALGQPVVIDNRSGAGGSIGAAILARSPADGYTLMITSTSYTTNAGVQPDLPFDPVRDVAAVAMIGRGPMMVVVAPAVPAQSFREFLALARSQPGKLNYTSSGVGSAPHLATELFMSLANVDMVHVPYKGLGPAMVDLIASRVQVLIASLPSVLPHVKASKVRGLAVTSAQRSPFAPGLPTVVESGVPGYTSELWWGLFAPARTPAPVTGRLHAETVRLVAADDMKKLLADAGAEPAALSTADFSAQIRAEIAKWTKLVKQRGIRAE